MANADLAGADDPQDFDRRATVVYGGEPVDGDRDELFRLVDLALAADEDMPQQWIWNGYVPAGYVTLLSGHGGAGKSLCALQLAVCVAMGLPAFERATQRVQVLFVSAEDDAIMVMRRLRKICRCLQVDMTDLRQWLQVVDMTSGSPVLFDEVRELGVRRGAVTDTYTALTHLVRREGFGFIVVDNASDTFGADEINRAMVRGFLRSLTAWARHGGAVMLLGHVDKNVSRGKNVPREGADEAYSGSTAWHNSVRSRLFLQVLPGGKLELLHQKCNVGPKLPPLQLAWSSDGVIQHESQVGAVHMIELKLHLRALLTLLIDFTERGEFVSPEKNSRNHAVALMGTQRDFPKGLKATEIFDLLRDAERDGLIERVQYRGGDRHPRSRWNVTAAGRELTARPAR